MISSTNIVWHMLKRSMPSLANTEGGGATVVTNEEQPLRSELFNGEQMEQHARLLAMSHRIETGQVQDQLLARLASNESALIGVCDLLVTADTAKRRITPAGEWLLDNFHLIEEQIRTAKRHLPKGYSRELPRLASGLAGPSDGRPRVYDMALEIISHGDGRVDEDVLRRFVSAYQTITPLKLGELWATPIMLRLAVIENLRRVAARISSGWSMRSQADVWADQMIETSETDPKSLILIIADMARSNPPMVSGFVAELARRLLGRGPALALPLTWIEQRLSESGMTIDQLVQLENQLQAADQVSVSNSIGSLRVLGAIDWADFVESMSVVEQTLREDPSGVYPYMDFATRDRYRHAAEKIAKRSRLAEWEVAKRAIDLARAGSGNGDKTGHVGFYLIDEGLPQVERVCEMRRSWYQTLTRAARRVPLRLYIGTTLLLSVLLTGYLLQEGYPRWLPQWALVPLGLLVLLATSQFALAMVNWAATLLVTPRALPRMDYSEGIPPRSCTLVVVPTMLGSTLAIENLVEALEVRFLANRDSCLRFGLLTDFLDAPTETLPEDSALVELARTRIRELNEKYCSENGGDAFFLFHRPRRWNPAEQVWMGYERKRGKLADLNALLRGDRGSRFSHVEGNTALLAGVKYVITLDTDTQLPRDAARQFVGVMAHPLNWPKIDPVRRCVTEGYAILQPRVAISLPGANRSRFARVYSGDAGIDPYTRAVSDVYQDVFGEGSFIGKGIYDVDAFEQVLGDRFPENRILSHDLLEGCYARSGLVSDVELFEEHPIHYGADVARRHRWIRGDWQLIGWLRRYVPPANPGAAHTADGLVRERNPLSALSRWKLVDNLRRSLVPTSLSILLLTGWALAPNAWFWTLAVAGILLIPPLCAYLVDLIRKPKEALFKQHLTLITRLSMRRFKQVLLELACLPFEAYYSLDAILRTLWRVLVSHRHLLEWNPSSEVDRQMAARGTNTLAGALRLMWVVVPVALGEVFYLAYSAPLSLAAAAPVLLLWLASPAIAWWVSQPLVGKRVRLSAEQVNFLREVSRRTWAFFDRFVAEEDNWLPPDNYQEYRFAVIAHRTSPTNIGMAMLANLSAYDFGYIQAGQLIERTGNTLRTMQELPRHRGHLYNWYDTVTLQPLPPLYVSSVDSGNLAGHLLTLRVGLYSLADEKVLSAQFLEGLRDTVRVLEKVTNKTGVGLVADFRRQLESEYNAPPTTVSAARAMVMRLTAAAEDLVSRISTNPGVEDSITSERERRRNQSEARQGGSSQTTAWVEALQRQCKAAQDELTHLTNDVSDQEIPTLRELARAGSAQAQNRLQTIEQLAQMCAEFANMEYDFLFDRTRHLLRIGYNVSERRGDMSYYDLLASEARLCCFVAIAQGQLPKESWFSLGRLLTSTGGDPVLLSWSGSMFEYLMPLLVMPTYGNTLLEQTYKASVERQIEYGNQRGVPWGVSESCYNTVDLNFTYQYRAFGVPGLGLKRGLAEDLVIAPYASALALMVLPEASCANLQRLAAEGFIGKFGFYEAIDYTPVRQRRGQKYTIIRSFMAHHQGMSLLSLAYVLLGRPMQRRFEADPQFQAILLLLQERIPKETSLFSHTAKLSEVRPLPEVFETPIRVVNTPDTLNPEVQLLSNGRYHVMVTNAGGGYSRWKDIAVTRWHEDATRDNWGSFCYVREITNRLTGGGGDYWSTTYQPTLKRPESYEAIFLEGRAEYRRVDAVEGGEGDFETHTEIVVSPEDDIELRRVRITNRSQRHRHVEVTSYAEVVIAPAAADASHPAFSNLFVQTEIVPERSAIICTRRPRSAGEQVPWMLHLMTVHGGKAGPASFETDRMRFVGRGRNTASPLAMDVPGLLSNSAGSVLDPSVSVRYRVELAPEQSVTFDVVTGVAETREGVMALIDKYRDRPLTDRVIDLAWTHNQVVLQQLNASEADSQLYARLASVVLYATSAFRADASVLVRNRRGQSGLWGYAISGDLPIVLLQIADSSNMGLVRQLVQAHAYWRLKGLAVDLVIWNEDQAGYRQQLQDQIMGLIASGIEASMIDRPGGIFVRQIEQISAEDRVLFQSVASAVLTDDRGALEEQLNRRPVAESRPQRLSVKEVFRSGNATRLYPRDSEPIAPRTDLILFNGLGGFTPDGREYVISLDSNKTTPAPWSNVLANPNFGTVISESGGAYTWSENAHEFRLSPWHNDPVSDASGEAIYLRDEDSGLFWSPTPLPRTPSHPLASASYVTRHGFGYSVFETRQHGIDSELWVYVAMDAAVKFSVLKVRNSSGRARKLSATGYVEWVLGDLRSKSALHITTEIDSNGAIVARNTYSNEFADRMGFFDADGSFRTATGDRNEFLGRNGTLGNPAAMHRAHLSGKVGAGLDPCAAMQIVFDLPDGEEREIVFRLGAARSLEEIGHLVRRFRAPGATRGVLETVWHHWNHTLGTVYVETPDPAVNVLANGWLVYQVLSCRIWARSGYYQSGGAFGFRDQLQDMMALVHTRPELVREHLLLSASRQFLEGDVQHWWHPPLGRGVRTHCSDDYLWLPFAVCRYVSCVGDTGVLDEMVSFLEGRPVPAGEESYYDLPGRSGDSATLYEHCVRAIRHGLRFGERGLPLIGIGDWNDGMNLVGIHGKGESVWLAFFLCEVLKQFSDLARRYGDHAFAEQCNAEEGRLRENIAQHAWDGEWYRRAYFDDGTPLGSASNDECRIDSISQSWSVLSRIGGSQIPAGSAEGVAERSRQAMGAVYEKLVRHDAALIQLLDPPFNKSAMDPGYIRGYVPGVRENGGQYTHAAVWTVMAFAAMGDHQRAWELFNLINPVNHGRSEQQIALYKVEPYVVTADVYAVEPHTGRGGWSWYTGSAGWMYRLIVESLLGLRLTGEKLHVAPRLPADWTSFKVHYRYRSSLLHLEVMRAGEQGAGPERNIRVIVDGVESEDAAIPLTDDHAEHQVEVHVYADAAP